MTSPLATARLARQAESIHTRDDLERWKIRSRTRLRFLLISYLVGALPLSLLTLFMTIQNAIKGGTISLNGFIFSLVPGFCCFGPIVLLPCFVLLNSGLTNYRKTMNQLKSQDRVCEACDAVALFEDKLVHPSRQVGHTMSDLVPQMHLVNHDGKTKVLCDTCLSQAT